MRGCDLSCCTVVILFFFFFPFFNCIECMKNEVTELLVSFSFFQKKKKSFPNFKIYRRNWMWNGHRNGGEANVWVLFTFPRLFLKSNLFFGSDWPLFLTINSCKACKPASLQPETHGYFSHCNLLRSFPD